MSTRSRITLKRLDGTNTSIYCHWDGYIENNGVLLQLCYDTPEKIEKLLKLGNLSSLYEYTDPNPNEEHSFEHPQKNVCIAYHRDRGEELEFWSDEQEFNYTFDESIGAWIVEREKYDCIKSCVINSEYEYRTYKTSFLIDEILKYQDNILKYWVDDEFATKENLIKTLTEKAGAQVRIANQRRAEEYDAWYRAYCD